LIILVAVPPVVPELSSDDDYSHFDDIPEPDSGEEFFPTPKVPLQWFLYMFKKFSYYNVFLCEIHARVNKK